MKKQKKNQLVEVAEPKTSPVKPTNDYDFDESMNVALKNKNDKKFFWLIMATVTVILVLLVGAMADVLTLCFEVNRIFGYVMSGVFVLLVAVFIIRPLVKVMTARFFVVDVTDENKKLARRRNRKALVGVATSLVEYNENPKNMRFRYLTPENTKLIKDDLRSVNHTKLREDMRKVYSTDVGKFANSVIFKSAGKVFLTTSVSQNDKIDALSVLLVNFSLIKQIVAIYGYRPSYAKLFRIYISVLKNALIAYGMQNVNWFNVFGKFFSGVAKKIPFIDTVVDSALQGTVSAFLTILVGYKTKRFLCSDYKKQEKIDVEGTEETGYDDEVEIAMNLAKEVRKQNKDKMPNMA